MTVRPYYEDDYVTLYHADNRDATDWTSGDVLVSDPPYGMNLKSGMGGEFGDLKIMGDDSTEIRDWVLDQWGDRPALVFGRWSVPRPTGTKTVLIWEKPENTGMGNLALPWRPNLEEIYVMGSWPDRQVGRTSSVLRSEAVANSKRGGRLHPTEKPVGLLRQLIGACPPGVIVDPFAGSGSTLRAAKDLGRRAVGVEAVEEFCEIAANRLAQDILPL